VFSVAQSGNEGASSLVLPTRGTPEWSPFRFTKQSLEEVFSETRMQPVASLSSRTGSIEALSRSYRGVLQTPRKCLVADKREVTRC
jgi:hypothetical protein